MKIDVFYLRDHQSFWQNTQHRKQHAVFLSKKRKYQCWAWKNCSCYFTCTSAADSENQIKIGHRNLESQQNDNIPRSVGETSLKQEKLQKRSKSTKCYIQFHNFPESSAKNFNVILHLQVSQIPKIKSKKGTGTWNPSRMTTFQGQSAKRHSNKKNFKSGQNQPNAIFIVITFRNHRQKFLMLFHIYTSIFSHLQRYCALFFCNCTSSSGSNSVGQT